jgi:hypothetical protein
MARETGVSASNHGESSVASANLFGRGLLQPEKPRARDYACPCHTSIFRIAGAWQPLGHTPGSGWESREGHSRSLRISRQWNAGRRAELPKVVKCNQCRTKRSTAKVEIQTMRARQLYRAAARTSAGPSCRVAWCTRRIRGATPTMETKAAQAEELGASIVSNRG